MQGSAFGAGKTRNECGNSAALPHIEVEASSAGRCSPSPVTELTGKDDPEQTSVCLYYEYRWTIPSPATDILVGDGGSACS